MELVIITLFYLVLGVTAGITSSLIGFGGGFFVVPAMFWSLKSLSVNQNALMHYSIGTSLAVMLFIALNSTYNHNKKRSVDWNLAWKIIPFITLGAILAAYFSGFFNGDFLRYFFIAYVFYTIVHALVKKTFTDNHRGDEFQLPSSLQSVCFGLSVGFLATTLGVGGSVITVPFFRKLKFTMAKASAMAVVFTLPVSIVGTIGYVMQGAPSTQLSGFSIGYIYWPAVIGVVIGSFGGVPIGTKLAYRLSDKCIARGYLLVLSLVFMIMLIA